MLGVPFLPGPLTLWFSCSDLINSTLVLLFLLEDDAALTTLCASCCAPQSFSSHRILSRGFLKDLLPLEECSGFTLWRGVCWSYHRSLLFLWPHFVGEDLSSQDVRLSVLLLASGREVSVRSEASLLKSLGKGILHDILQAGRELCSSAAFAAVISMLCCPVVPLDGISVWEELLWAPGVSRLIWDMKPVSELLWWCWFPSLK